MLFIFNRRQVIAEAVPALDNKTDTDAVLDRIVHSSYQIQLVGETMRKMKGPNTKRIPKAVK